MKIGISVTPIYTLQGAIQNIDGIGTYTNQLYQALVNQSISVQKIYFKKTGDTFTRAQTKDFWIASNPLYSLSPGNFHNSLYASKIDLLHITNYLVPRIKHVPVISTIHDAIMLKHPEWLEGPHFLRRLKGRVLKKLNHHIDFAITCSQASVADLVNYWQIPEEKIAVTHYGLADIWQQPIDAKQRQQVLNKYQLNKPFFLMVGTLQPRKNTERTINAYLSLPPHITQHFNLIIVGKEHATLTSPLLLKKMNTLQQRGQLSWLKYISFEDLRCLYQSAYALLFPSLAEGFGFPILEGFASGIPVITADLGSMREIASDAAYLVDPYEEESIAAAMLALVETSHLRDQLIHKGLAQVKQFTWEQCAKKTIAVYNTILKC